MTVPSKDAIVNAEEAHGGHVDESLVLMRQAFDQARSGRFDQAQISAQEAVRKVKDKRANGYLKQQLAEYVHHTNPVEAQTIQLSALEMNKFLVRPIRGITYAKLETLRDSQSVAAVTYMKRFLEKNDLLVWVNALLEDLSWGEENSKRFEKAIDELGVFLGFGSQRPEENAGKGPDNLWAIGNLKYLVIECKSGATKSKFINKHDCNQLNGSMVWFSSQYDASCSATPVIIHPKTKPEFAATLHRDTKVVTEAALSKLTQAVRDYAVAIAEALAFTDNKRVNEQLKHFGLTKDIFITRFTERPS